MNVYTRRAIIQGSACGLMNVVGSVKQLAAASGLGRTGGRVGLSWDDFVNQVSVLARESDSSHWNQENYVATASTLLTRLRPDSPKLMAAQQNYRNRHPGRPEFISLERRVSFQIELITFEKGEHIPLHDHPRMTGVSMCILGEVRVRNYELLRTLGHEELVELKLATDQTMNIGKTSTLTASRANVHTLWANQSAQIVDIFAPPYDDERANTTRWYHPLPNGPVGRDLVCATTMNRKH